MSVDIDRLIDDLAMGRAVSTLQIRHLRNELRELSALRALRDKVAAAPVVYAVYIDGKFDSADDDAFMAGLSAAFAVDDGEQAECHRVKIIAMEDAP